MKQFWRGLSLEERRFSYRESYSLPLFARLKELYVVGFIENEIFEQLKSEFNDIEVNPITLESIKQLISLHKEELEAHRDKMSNALDDKVIELWKDQFKLIFAIENRAVKAVGEKLDAALMALIAIDMTEINDKGVPVNLGAASQLLEFIERTTALLGKIAGTNAFRDFELYKMKKQFDAFLNPKGAGGLLPAAPTNGMPNVAG